MKNIPVITVSGKTLAETYEAALINLYKKGTRFKTQYDKPGDPLSIDCTMNMTIEEPETDPVIHMAFPGGIEDLKEYVLELKGYKDHWVKNINDEKDTRWEYTYHGRIKNYGVWKELQNDESLEVGPFKVDQIESVINKLSKQPFTRQAQMITWMPNLDLTTVTIRLVCSRCGTVFWKTRKANLLAQLQHSVQKQRRVGRQFYEYVRIYSV
jgi:thymidylate synthase